MRLSVPWPIRLDRLRDQICLDPVAVDTGDLLALTALAAAVALSQFAVFFPGLWTNDSLGRWREAYRMVHAADWDGARLSDWFPPLMTLLMAVSLKLGGSVLGFTFIQYWFVNLGALVAVFAVIGQRGAAILIGLLVLLCPGVADNAGLVMPDPWTAGALAIAASGLALHPREGSRAVVPLRLIVFAGDFVLFGFRANSVTVFVALFALGWLVIRPRDDRRWYLGLLVVALALDIAVSHLPIITHDDVAAPILLWEITCTLKIINDPAVTAQYAVLSMGDMNAAIAQTDFWVQDKLYWWPGHPYTPDAALQHADEIRSTWFALVTAHPVAYLRAKLRMWGWLAGFNFVDRPFAFLTKDVTDQPELNALMRLGPVDDKMDRLSDAARWINLVGHRRSDWFYTPWRLAIIAAGAVAVLGLAGGRWRLALVLCLSALAYYAAFFIISPGFQLRYFFPAGFLFDIVVISAVVIAAERLTVMLRARAKG